MVKIIKNKNLEECWAIIPARKFKAITGFEIEDVKDKIKGILDEYSLNYIQAIKYHNGEFTALYLDENGELCSFEKKERNK